MRNLAAVTFVVGLLTAFAAVLWHIEEALTKYHDEDWQDGLDDPWDEELDCD